MYLDKIKAEVGRQTGILSVLFGMEGSTSIFKIAKIATNKTILKNLKTVKFCLSKIDDNLDNTDLSRFKSADELLEHSLRKLNEDYPDNKYVEHFLDIKSHKNGLGNDFNRFGKLFAQMVIDENDHRISGERDKASQIHLQMSGVEVAFLSHVIKSASGEQIGTDDLTLDKVRCKYPRAFVLGCSTQIIDDIKDVIPDMLSEIKSKTISSNVLLAQFEKSGCLDKFANICNRSKPEELENIIPNKLDTTFIVPLRQLKDTLQHNIKDLPLSSKYLVQAFSKIYSNSRSMSEFKNGLTF